MCGRYTFILTIFSIALPLALLVMALRHWFRLRDRGLVWRDLGFSRTGREGRDLGAGLLIGLVAILGVFLVEWTAGWLIPGGVHRPALRLLWLLPALTGSALFEEVMHRGGVLTGLRLYLPTWAAVAVAALVFGAAHAANPHATPLSVLSNGLGGLMYGVAFVGSGSIWLSFGLHLAWNTTQGPLLGFPVSGFDFGGLWHPVISGPVHATGGAYGPEGGLVGIGFRLLVIMALAVYIHGIRGGRKALAQ